MVWILGLFNGLRCVGIRRPRCTFDLYHAPVCCNYLISLALSIVFINQLIDRLHIKSCSKILAFLPFGFSPINNWTSILYRLFEIDVVTQRISVRIPATFPLFLRTGGLAVADSYGLYRACSVL
jgi:hypothetical protein